MMPAMRRGFAAALCALSLLSPSLAQGNATDDQTPSGPGQSTFVSESGNIAFGLTVGAQREGEKVTFSMRVPVGYSWGAVGIGSDEMEGALVLMMYLNERGDNVTFSPRYGMGHFEPAVEEDVRVEVLDGTGIVGSEEDGGYYMVFRALCTAHCRSWRHGAIDANDENQRGIYALGPREDFRSDSRHASVKYHEEFGSFRINMGRTMGVPDAPALPLDATSDGTEPLGRRTGQKDGQSLAHGILMLLCFVLAFPVGVVLLRFKGFAWHAALQLGASLGVVTGFALGVVTSLRYQRSMKFQSLHQILGFILVACVMAQPALGYFHHRQFMRTERKGWLSIAHRWLGRVAIFVGVINVFVGFTFARNTNYGRVLAGILLFVCAAFILLILLKLFRRRRQQQKRFAAGQGPHPHLGQQPWRQAPPPPPGGASGAAAGNATSGSRVRGGDGFEEQQPQNIGLVPVSSPTREERREGEGEAKSYANYGSKSREDLGPAQSGREFV